MSEKPATLETVRDSRTTSAESITEVNTEYFAHGGYRFAILTLRNADRRPVTLGPASLNNFEAAVRALDMSGVNAVAVTGTGPVFCAGADLKKMTEAVTPEQAADVSRRGIEAFALLEALPVPTFAFINGIALGGGLELALHARYRTVSESARALGFPEVRLGLIPGWGGIPRAAALLGPAVTARLVVSDSLGGKNLSGRAAAGLGLVDAVVPEDGFLAASLDFASGVLSGTPAAAAAAPATAAAARDGGAGPEPAPAVGPVALEDIREQLDTRLHGAAPAPYRALDLIAAAAAPTGAPAQETEIRAFGELLLSDEARASIYAFGLTQSLARNPAGRPAVGPLPVRSVGVVGAGLMASQLALVFARELRVPVRMTDLSQDRIHAALEWIAKQLDKLAVRGQLDPAEAEAIGALVTGGIDKKAFADCDVVIEAVFEELEVKRAVLAELEPLLRPEALLLTNTSSLSIEEMGAGLANPGRLIGFHFFNPVAVLPLVEIITTPCTDETTLATAFELAKRLRKTAVLVTDTAGFVVNRVLTRLFSEVLSLLDDGADPATVDHALDPLGLPMTPLQLLQFIGPAVQLHICEKMHQSYPERFGVSASLAKLVAAGLPGYLDDDGGLSPEAASLLPAPMAADAGAVRYRILAALAEEVTAMLEEGVVAGPEQIDLCMILGANYPFHTGGLTPLLDRDAGTGFHPELRVSGLPSPRELARHLARHLQGEK
ncbi:3-hydroxyacyl-CoA dehydrogenase NAD-binding domain-containing protein [Arthrobacter sp. MA-N2]|uniref:3-hydroxyacyl-CoA dehydrogenase NAD-binding domain-containing protein n=1 Tax=Arthrobacter sp. MA-N2 TaxID=1101188 RepID=UPI0004B864C4|nr:3-hydroxyacyl-CoA dehydrogenase NAD-binding domain-containing protein [Arthrobacter sp. MA-N2]